MDNAKFAETRQWLIKSQREALEMATLVLDFVIQKLPSEFDRE